jgi:PTH1 family peptidyl-tRNA hydrolase
VGFRTVEALAEQCAARWVDDNQTWSEIALAHADELTLVLAKPQTYMNRSGEAVAQLLKRLRLTPQQVLIVYDDMDLPFGTLRLRERGSPGTHNGMRSIVRALDTEAIPRLRIGISQAHTGTAIDHVLSAFSADEQAQVDDLVSRAADAALTWAKRGAEAAMNRYNKI